MRALRFFLAGWVAVGMAAQGGAADTPFPWTDYTNNISHDKANYIGVSDLYDYDLSIGYHPAYTNGDYPYTSPSGSLAL